MPSTTLVALEEARLEGAAQLGCVRIGYEQLDVCHEHQQAENCINMPQGPNRAGSLLLEGAMQLEQVQQHAVQA